MPPFCRSDRKEVAGYAGETAAPAKHDAPKPRFHNPPSPLSYIYAVPVTPDPGQTENPQP
ncbi:hypothetical protein CBM2634_A80066 [Cupriavidus taiwanensis]|uniref:Uncharacterized protein n=1 Tax=Cupriavidus taiwanensis TaxID=164546 RepID=A0A375J1T9_9BURK|nr:hypothetical protein CBM2634_A80066 [Cupriavidus taiwanensis]